jgi:hypothetical protein
MFRDRVKINATAFENFLCNGFQNAGKDQEFTSLPITLSIGPVKKPLTMSCVKHPDMCPEIQKYQQIHRVFLFG